MLPGELIIIAVATGVTAYRTFKLNHFNFKYMITVYVNCCLFGLHSSFRFLFTVHRYSYIINNALKNSNLFCKVLFDIEFNSQINILKS